MFYRAYIFQNVNVSRFSKVKPKLKLFKGHQCLLSHVGLFPLEFLQHLKDSLRTGRLFHLGTFFLCTRDGVQETPVGFGLPAVSSLGNCLGSILSLRVSDIKISIVLSVRFLAGMFFCPLVSLETPFSGRS